MGVENSPLQINRTWEWIIQRNPVDLINNPRHVISIPCNRPTLASNIHTTYFTGGCFMIEQISRIIINFIVYDWTVMLLLWLQKLDYYEGCNCDSIMKRNLSFVFEKYIGKKIELIKFCPYKRFSLIII